MDLKVKASKDEVVTKISSLSTDLKSVEKKVDTDKSSKGTAVDSKDLDNKINVLKGTLHQIHISYIKITHPHSNERNVGCFVTYFITLKISYLVRDTFGVPADFDNNFQKLTIYKKK